MNKNVNIEFMISVGDNRIAVTMQEARELFVMFNSMFNQRQQVSPSASQQGVITKATEKPIVKPQAQKIELSEVSPAVKPTIVSDTGSEEKPSVNLRDRINSRLDKQKKSMQSQLDDANTRIDSARERAAARTRGCSSMKGSKSCS
jgi:hypothetical protein